MSDNEVLQRLEEERERRMQEKLSTGQAVLAAPTILGLNPATPLTEGQRDAKGREVYHGIANKEGGVDRITCIITGVPRIGRDDDGEPIVRATNTSKTWTCSNCGQSLPNDARYHRCSPVPVPQVPPPRSASPLPSIEEAPRRYIWTQSKAPTEGDPGSIVEGEYLVQGDMVYVWSGGVHLGRLAIAQGDDAAVVARRLLRDKTGSNAFYAPLRYPTKTFH
jgi:hypothetical protein